MALVETERSARDLLVGAVSGVAAVVIWAGWIVWTRGDMRGAPVFTPVDIGLLRFSAPAFLLAPFWLKPLLRARSVKAPRLNWPGFALFLGWGAPFILIAAYGLQSGGAALMAALTPGTAPLWAAALAAALFSWRPPRAARLGFTLIGLGVVLSLFATPAANLIAAPWFLIAGLLWAGYIVMAPRSGLTAIEATGLMSAWSTALLVALAWPLGSRLLSAPADALLIGFIAQGLFSGVISAVAYTIALDRLPRATAAALPAAVPILASLMAWGLTDEPMSLWSAAAIAITSLGLFLTTQASARNGR